MAGGSFGGTVKLKGEAEYKRALKNINSSLKVFASSLKLVTSEYGKNNKGIEALTAKQKVLVGQITTQKNKVQACKDAMKDLTKQQSENKNKITEMTTSYNNAKVKLESMKSSTTATNEEIKKQEEVVRKLGTELTNAKTAYNSCNIKLDTWQVSLNNAKTELNRMENELKDNEKAMKTYENATEKEKKQLEQFGNIVEESNEKTSTFGDVLKANLASEVIISGVQKLASAVKELLTNVVSVGAPFEQAMSKVQAISGATGEDLAKLEQKAREMGESTSKSATESAEALSYMSLAGWNTQQMIEGIEPILRMSEAAGSDLATTSDLVTDSMSALGVQTNQLGKYLDIVAKSQNSSNTSATQMLEAYIECGGTFKNLKVSLEESSTLLGVLANRGMKGAEAGTALNSILVNLTGGSSTAKEAMKKLGVSAWDSKGKFIGVEQTLRKLGKALDKCTEQQKTNFESAIGGKTQLTTLQNLIAGLDEEYGTLKTSITNCDGALLKTAKTMQDNFSGDLTQMKSKLEGIQVTIYKKLSPTLRKLVQAFQDWANSVDWERLGNKIQKVMNSTIKVFKWFIDNKKVFVSAISGMVAVFAVNKVTIFATAFKGLLMTFKSSTTIIAGVTKVLEALNLTALANPYVALAAAIVGVTTALTVWTLKSDETRNRLKQEREAAEYERNVILENKQAWDELVKSKQEAINTGMTEIDYSQKLYNEMQSLVEANGKIKKGYEGRVGFITSTLSEALGIEINIVDGVIKKYDSLKNTFDKVMEKKKAMIVLESQEELYKEALNNKADALLKYNEIEEELTNKRKERAEIQKKIDDEELKSSSSQRGALLGVWKSQAKKMDKIISEKESAYNTLDKQLKEYVFNIGTYEKNMALAHEERYSEISNVNYELVKDYETAEEQQKAVLERQIQVEKETIEYLEQFKGEKNAEIYNSQIEASQKQLSKLEEDLKQYTDTTVQGNRETTQAWKDGLKNQLTEILNKNVEFKDVGNGQVQLYIDGVKQGQPAAETKMSNFASSIIQKVKDKEMDAKTAGKLLLQGLKVGLNDDVSMQNIQTTVSNVGASILKLFKISLDEHSPSRATKKMGEYLLDGIYNGISNQDKRNSIFNSIASFGTKLLTKLKSSLQEHSPSKATREMGSYLLQGLGLGISDEENAVIKQVSRFGEDIIDAFSIDNMDKYIPKTLDFAIDSNLTSMNLNKAKSTKNAINYNSKIDTLINITEKYFPQLLEASKSNMQVVLDTGRLVGETRELYDREFRNSQFRAERGTG